jgi:uncharacterized protein YjbI with pentapeptide repeats
MGTDRADEHSLAVIARSEEEKDLTLPALAAKADDLEAIRKAVEDAAAVSGGLWLSYLFVLLYIAIAAGAVTHVDLLLENPVKLPFLNVELPLKAFFFLAPLLFLITHAYTLAHLVLLADKAKRFHVQLREQIKAQGDEPESDDNKKAAGIRAGLRRQLPSNIFVQFLAGPDDIRESWFGVLLKAIAWTSLVIGPVLLLLLLQIQFLPYHYGPITWTHRLALLADLLLIWWLWRKILSGRSDFRRWRRWTSWAAPALGIVASFAALVFSWAVTTFPGEWQEDHLPSFSVIPAQWTWKEAPRDESSSANRISAHEWLFAGDVDDITRRRKSFFSSTLVLPGFNIYEALKTDDPKKVEWKEHSIDLRGRHLEGVVFDGANLPTADLSGAHLERASLFGARLQGASLNGARLQGANIFWAQLQGASLQQAQLQGTSLMFTQLQGASLHEAQLQGAFLAIVQLGGATLNRAQLQGAYLVMVQLWGASLVRAQLQGAWLQGSTLWGASLENAQLQGAMLDSDLSAVDMSKAFVRRAFGYPANTGGILASDMIWRAEYFDDKHFDDGKPRSDPWTQEKYQALRQAMERDVPPGRERTEALRRIEVLDCEKKKYVYGSKERDTKTYDFAKRSGEQLPDEISVDLAPCDLKAESPVFAAKWRQEVERVAVDYKKHVKALTIFLGEIVCEGLAMRSVIANAENLGKMAFTAREFPIAPAFAAGLAKPSPDAKTGAVDTLRGLLENGRFEATGAEAPALAARILGKDCPVSAALTEDDKARLRAFQKPPEQPRAKK